MSHRHACYGVTLLLAIGDANYFYGLSQYLLSPVAISPMGV